MLFRPRLLICLLLAAGGAGAQVIHPFPADYPYLLRVEHELNNVNTCVLLKKDGSYHFERNHNEEHFTVNEGELTPEARANIARLLQQPDLLNLKQNELATPPFLFDEVIVNVFRGDHWQDLIFQDTRDHRSVVPSVAALVDWMDGLPKLPHRELTEFEGRNNCLTEHKIELRVRPPAPLAGTLPAPPQGPVASSARTSAPPDIDKLSQSALEMLAPTALGPPSFVVWMSVVRFGDPMQRQCVVVYPDGHFHAEKGGQPMSGQAMGEDAGAEPNLPIPPATQVSEGALPASALENLEQITRAPEWQITYSEQLPSDVIIRSGELIEVRLPEAGDVARSTFMNVQYERVGQEIPRQGIEELSALPASHQKVVAPLRSWFKKNIEDANLPVIPNGFPSFCTPQN